MFFTKKENLARTARLIDFANKNRKNVGKEYPSPTFYI
ncbi:Hypothetical protein AJF4211_000830 [Avibacterium paragallinarum JF4211]|nr:Hypothetical protein AJF4211_000830 [Avibacterium paragallinarum JF4211]